jgi:hypothetical protein
VLSSDQFRRKPGITTAARYRYEEMLRLARYNTLFKTVWKTVIFWHVQTNTTVYFVFFFPEESGHITSACTTAIPPVRRYFYDTFDNGLTKRPTLLWFCHGVESWSLAFHPQKPGLDPSNMGFMVGRMALTHDFFECLGMRPVSYLSTDDRIHSSTIRVTAHPPEAADPRCSLFSPQNNTVRSLARLVSMVLYI